MYTKNKQTRETEVTENGRKGGRTRRTIQEEEEKDTTEEEVKGEEKEEGGRDKNTQQTRFVGTATTREHPDSAVAVWEPKDSCKWQRVNWKAQRYCPFTPFSHF